MTIKYSVLTGTVVAVTMGFAGVARTTFHLHWHYISQLWTCCSAMSETRSSTKERIQRDLQSVGLNFLVRCQRVLCTSENPQPEAGARQNFCFCVFWQAPVSTNTMAASKLAKVSLTLSFAQVSVNQGIQNYSEFVSVN